MKRTQLIFATAGATIAFLAGQLTAQPPAPEKPPAKITQTPRQQEFMADLSAAIKFNNNAKANTMLAEAARDRELASAVVEKMWDYSQRENPAEVRKGEVMEATFKVHQSQRQTELLEEILTEIKKRPNVKE